MNKILDLRLAKINLIIKDLDCVNNPSNSRTANHFVALKNRLVSGKKLTKKMAENLAFIDAGIDRELFN